MPSSLIQCEPHADCPPLIRAGRPRSITPPMLDALCDHLPEKPGLYVDEMVVFLLDEFDILTSTASVKRALCRAGWTKKKGSTKSKGAKP